MTQTNPNTALQYVTIDDFRPGINSNVRIAPVNAAVSVSQTRGYAQEGTVGCYATNDGALTPLPGINPNVTGGIASGLNSALIHRPTMFGVAGPITDSAGALFDVFFAQLTSIDPNAGAPRVHMVLCINDNGSNFPIGFTQTFNGGAGQAPPASIPNITSVSWGGAFEFTRTINSGFTTAGIPSVFMDWTETNDVYPLGSFLKRGFIFPDPTNTGGTNTPNIITGFSDPTTYFTYDGRILGFAWISSNFGLDNSSYNNENIFYGDPPNNWRLNTTPTILDPQYPGGYGSWGTMSFGELMLVKRNGGGLLISGDIFSPSVTRMPGVMSTGSLVNKASSSISGMVYLVANDGAYLWDGGNTSTKVSTISDDFYVRPSGTTPFGIQAEHCAWGNFVVFPNGWLMDCVNNNTWWNINSSPAQAPGNSSIALLYPSATNPNRLWFMEDIYQNTSTITISCFDTLTPQTAYTWIGQPIPIEPTQQIDIREVAITVSYPGNVVGGAIDLNVAFCDVNGVFDNMIQFTNVQVQSNQPQTFRSTGGVRAFTITPEIQIAAHNGTDPAPNVVQLTVGYSPASLAGQGA